MRFSLKLKAAAAITLLFLGMMALIATVQTRFIRADLVDAVTAQQLDLVRAATEALDLHLQTNLRALTAEAMAIPPEILARPQEFAAYLERQPALLLFFDALLVYSPTGEILADAPRVAGRAGTQSGDREYFKRSIATLRPVISAPFLTRATRQPGVTMTAPILDGDGRLVGFLGGLASTRIGKTGFFFAMTKDQPSVYVVHPDLSLILKTTGADAMPDYERAMIGHEGTSEGVDGHGIPGLFSYMSLTTTNWVLATNYPLAEALAPVVAAEMRLWTITAAVATLLAPLVWLLTWFLIAPLLRLHDDVLRLRQSTGAISPILQARKDEIGDLARDFDALIAGRQHNVEALRRSTQLLDNIVENIPAAIQLKSVQDDFRFVMWNKAAETLFGLPRERVIGHTTLETWSDEEMTRFHEADLVAVASNGQEFASRPITTANRGTIISHMRKVPLFDDDGMATHLLVIMDDVTDRVAADARLAQSEARFRGAVESALDAFFVLDGVRNTAGEICDFRFRYLNANAERLISKPAEQAIGQLLCELFPAQRSDGHFEKYTAVVKTGIPLDEEYRARTEGVDAQWLHHQVVRLEDGIAITTRDISARRIAEEELRTNRALLQASEHRLRTIADTMPAPIAYFDREEIYRFANTAFERMFNLEPEQVRGRTIRDVVGEAGHQFIKPYLNRAFGGEQVTFERKQSLANGVRWIEATYIPEIDESNNEVVGVQAMLLDITGQKIEKQRLLRLSQVDSLTGLANRVGFEQRLSDAMAETRITRQALAVMYFDLDHFKQINDTHGHAVGDALLLAFAQRLRRTLRNTDIVARLGGDEFVVVMERMPDPEVADRLATQALEEILRPFALDGHSAPLMITTSIGIAFFDGGATTADQLVAEADAMLYAAKRKGRNNVCIAPWPHQARTSESRLH